MSSYICKHCGKQIIDSPTGYITGCEHYPIYNSKICDPQESTYYESITPKSKNSIFKPVTIMFEIAGPIQFRPGYFSGKLKNGRFKRVWWLWFAISWVKLDLPDFCDYIKEGNTQWINKKGLA